MVSGHAGSGDRVVQVGGQALADRYTYVPLIGVFIAVAWGISPILSELRYRRLALGAVAGALLLVLSLTARIQSGYWRDSVTLLSRAVAVTKGNWAATNTWDFTSLCSASTNKPTVISGKCFVSNRTSPWRGTTSVSPTWESASASRRSSIFGGIAARAEICIGVEQPWRLLLQTRPISIVHRLLPGSVAGQAGFPVARMNLFEPKAILASTDDLPIEALKTSLGVPIVNAPVFRTRFSPFVCE